MENDMKVGFIGLGVMGLPMAGHLLAAGHELFIFDRRGCPDALQGANLCESSTDVASKSEVVIVMVPDTPDVEAVLFGEMSLYDGLKPGTLVIDMSSISPVATKEFANRLQEKGCDYVDGPVSGGEVGAQQATLSIMAGGTEAAFARALPLFELMGKNITHVGEVGSGQTTKIANQIVVALNIGAVAEALTFAAGAGADPRKVRQALMGGFASSRVLEVHGERMIERRFEPGFRIELHQKDLNNALETARKVRMSLPATSLAQQLFSACAAHGGAAQDHSALVKAYEFLNGQEIV